MAAGSVAGTATDAEAQTTNPIAGSWWPSPWGPNDERDATNRITPAKVLEAARLIKTGKIYQLSRVLEKGIPLFGERLGAHVVIPGSPAGGPFGKHQLHYHDELFVGEIGQAGTQFDGLGHIGMVANDGKLRYYNGLTQEQVGGTYGLKKLGRRFGGRALGSRATVTPSCSGRATASSGRRTTPSSTKAAPGPASPPVDGSPIGRSPS